MILSPENVKRLMRLKLRQRRDNKNCIKKKKKKLGVKSMEIQIKHYSFLLAEFLFVSSYCISRCIAFDPTQFFYNFFFCWQVATVAQTKDT